MIIEHCMKLIAVSFLLSDYSLLYSGSVLRLPTISPIFRIPFSTQ